MHGVKTPPATATVHHFSCQTLLVADWCTLHVHCTGSERVAHRRRIELKGKAKVVAPGWGTEFVKFLAALAVLPQSIRKNGMNSTLSFK